MLHSPLDDGVAHCSHAVGVGDHHRSLEKPVPPPRSYRSSRRCHSVNTSRQIPDRRTRSFARPHRVTVRTGPSPTFSLPEPEIKVAYPTWTPATSVMALNGPGVPSNGIPKSRARSFDCAETTEARAIMTTIITRRSGHWIVRRCGIAGKCTNSAQTSCGMGAQVEA